MKHHAQRASNSWLYATSLVHATNKTIINEKLTLKQNKTANAAAAPASESGRPWVASRLVSPEISGNFPRKISENFWKFIPIFAEISGKLPKQFYRELFTTKNLPNNCAFAYNDAFERLLQHL